MVDLHVEISFLQESIGLQDGQVNVSCMRIMMPLSNMLMLVVVSIPWELARS